MPKEVASQLSRARGVQTETDKASLALSALAERFARFRGSHQRYARVPQELRAAALAVLRQGVPEGALRGACGISSSQLVTWMKRSADSSRAVASVAEAVGVFDVVDDARPGGTQVGAAEQTLELRAGPWFMTVRFAGSEPGGR